MSTTWLYTLPIAAIIGFCFWKPNFPRFLALKLGIKKHRSVTTFLVIYWIMIPIIIHRLMTQIRVE